MHIEHFKRVRHPSGTEYFNYPSPFALRVWFYVRAIGHSRHDPSFRVTHRNEGGCILHFMRRGALWHRMGDSTQVVRAGEACLFELSREVSYGVDGRHPAEFWWVWLGGSQLPLVFKELRADRDPVFRSFDPTRMESLFRDLCRLTDRQPSACEAKQSGLLTLMLAELQASLASRPRSAVAGDYAQPLSPPIRRAIDYITRRYELPLTVKRIAALAARQSLYHFSRQFHREVGLSPSLYVKQFRVEQARRLLESTSRPIAEIARCVGFADQAYFTRVFTQFTGASPRQYRRAKARNDSVS